MYPHGEGLLGCEQALLVVMDNLGWVEMTYSDRDIPSYRRDFPWLA